jgi:hypothetical protein
MVMDGVAAVMDGRAVAWRDPSIAAAQAGHHMFASEG